MMLDDMAELLGKDKPVVHKALVRLRQGKGNEWETRTLLTRLLKREGVDVEKIGPFMPAGEKVAGCGEIEFATDEMGRRISLQPSRTNIVTTGRSGTGKTTLIKGLAYKYIYEESAQTKLIDLLGNFSKLQDYLGDTVVLDTPSMNVMHNDGVPQQKWVNVLFDIVSFHTDTMIGGRAFLNRTNSKLARIFEGTGEKYCIKDLSGYMMWMLEKRKLNMTDRGYAERIVGKILSWDDESEGAFAYQMGILEGLESCNQIISLRGLSEELQRFYVSVLIARDFMKRLFSPGLCRRPLVYMVDEAKHVFPHRDERMGLSSRTLSILTQTRNVDMYWQLGSQEPSKLAHTCLANSQTKIVLGITEGLDLSVIQQSLRLTPEQVKTISRFGEPGQAVVKFSERYTEPFMAKIDLFEEPEEVRTEDIAGENRRLVEEAEKSVVPRSRLLEKDLFLRDKERTSKYGRLSSSAERLLVAAGGEPYKPLMELYEKSGLGTKGSKARKELVMAGFVADRDIPVKTRSGRGKSLLNITEKGRSWLKDAGIRPLITGKGGSRELYYSIEIEKWALQRGFAVYREYKGADLFLVSEDKGKVAVEIACRKDNQLRNIRRDFETGIFHKIVVACETEKVLKEVRAEYESAGIDPGACEVSFLLVKGIMV